MKKRAKKMTTCVVATALLFLGVAPSMTGTVEAKAIQVNQKTSKISDLLEQTAFDKADFVFLQQKEKEFMESQNMPLLASRAFAPRTVGRSLGDSWPPPEVMHKALTAVGFGWTQIRLSHLIFLSIVVAQLRLKSPLLPSGTERLAL